MQCAVVFSFRSLVESQPIPLASLHGSDGFSGLLLPNVKPGDSSVVSEYHVEEFTCSVLAEHFIA